MLKITMSPEGKKMANVQAKHPEKPSANISNNTGQAIHLNYSPPQIMKKKNFIFIAITLVFVLLLVR